MKFIGITGGVGAGKSEILSYLAKKEGIKVLLADEIAHELMKPGGNCYKKICELYGDEDIFLSTGEFDRGKMAKVLFSFTEKRKRINDIVHPKVKAYVIEQAERERERKAQTLLILEAALLIEEHYDEICDELWYIYTREDVREQRLMASRGYSREKIRSIFESQLSEGEYRRHCVRVIDNNGTTQESFWQIEEAIKKIRDEQGDTIDE